MISGEGPILLNYYLHFNVAIYESIYLYTENVQYFNIFYAVVFYSSICLTISVCG